jgi:hypothetical protein
MSKLVDKNGRLFGKISVVDLLILVVVIIMAAAWVIRSNGNEAAPATASTQTVSYEMMIREIRQNSLNLLHVGDTLWDDHGVNLGVITAIASEPATGTAATVDGTFRESSVAERLNVTVSVSAQCSAADGHYFAERRTELAVGAIYIITTKYNKTEGRISAINSQ